MRTQKLEWSFAGYLKDDVIENIPVIQLCNVYLLRIVSHVLL